MSTTTGTIVLSNTSISSSITTGALIIAGGIGVTGNVNTISLVGTSMTSSGGLSVGLNNYIGGTLTTGVLTTTNTTVSTSTTTGAITVVGGMGAGGTINATSMFSGGVPLGTSSAYTGTSGNISLTGSTFNFTATAGYTFLSNLIVQGGISVAGAVNTLYMSVTGNLVCSGALIAGPSPNGFGTVQIGSGTAFGGNLTVSGSSAKAISTTHGYIASTGGATNSTASINFNYSGNFAAGILTAANVVVVSDIRNKKDIQPLDSMVSLDKINKLNPVTFNWKDKMNHVHNRVSGFIAQEVRQVDPTLAPNNRPDFIADMYAFKPVKIVNKQVHIKNTGYQVGDTIRVWLKTCQDEITVDSVDQDDTVTCTVTKPEWKDHDDEKIFVYGKHVKDVHSVSPFQVLALSVSATQELAQLYTKTLSDFEKKMRKL